MRHPLRHFSRRAVALFAALCAAPIAFICATATHTSHPAHSTHGTPASRLRAAPPLRRHVEPVIDAPMVTPRQAVAGEALAVRYGSHGARGDVWLLDQQGRVWAHGRVLPGGTTSIAVPERAAGQNLRVVVSARRGDVFDQRSIAVAILPDPSNVVPLDDDAIVPPSGVTVRPERVETGKTIRVVLPPNHGEALVSMTDPGGSILEQLDVAPGVRSATLRAPQAGEPTTYDVVVSVTHGHEEDQTVHPITVVP